MFINHDNKRKEFKVLRLSKNTDLCLLEGADFLKSVKIAKKIIPDELIFTRGYPYDRYQITQAGVYKGPTEVQIKWPKEECAEDKYFLEKRKFKSQFGIEQTICIATFDDMIFTTILSGPGASGSPIINERGELVGVISMIHTRGVNWAIGVSLEDVKKFIKDEE
jgi:hypothetical protein